MEFSQAQQERIDKIRGCIQDVSQRIEEVRRWQIEVGRIEQTKIRDHLIESGELMITNLKNSIMDHYKDLGAVYDEIEDAKSAEVLPNSFKFTRVLDCDTIDNNIHGVDHGAGRKEILGDVRRNVDRGL
jgi:hypothetical protein